LQIGGQWQRGLRWRLFPSSRIRAGLNIKKFVNNGDREGYALVEIDPHRGPEQTGAYWRPWNE
jgi:hypothetical protein